MDECVAMAVAEAVAVAVAVTEVVAEADQSIHDQSIHDPSIRAGVQSGPKWSQVVPCGPKLSQGVPCGPKLSLGGPLFSHNRISATVLCTGSVFGSCGPLGPCFPFHLPPKTCLAPALHLPSTCLASAPTLHLPCTCTYPAPALHLHLPCTCLSRSRSPLTLSRPLGSGPGPGFGLSRSLGTFPLGAGRVRLAFVVCSPGSLGLPWGSPK